MSTLQIIKLQSGAFKHVDSMDGEFFLGRFSFKNEFNIAFLVEAYGAKRREYGKTAGVIDIEVFDYLGTAETFTNWTDLINRLVALGYTGIDTNSIPNPFNPLDYDLVDFNNLDADPFARMSDLGGGGDDYIKHKVKWKSFHSTSVNTWKAPSPDFFDFDNAVISNFGTGTTPTDGTAGLYISWDSIPTGYLVDSITLEVNLRNGAGNLQVYIDRAEAATSAVSNVSNNVVNLVNQVVAVAAGSDRSKFIYHLTIASHSAPTLAESFTKISVRETTNADIYYSFNFDIIYKKI